jgi:hypothetical protein
MIFSVGGLYGPPTGSLFLPDTIHFNPVSIRVLNVNLFNSICSNTNLIGSSQANQNKEYSSI